jgi:hypothetical protein
MTPEEIKSSIRDAVNHMVKAEPEDQERANELIRSVIRTKAAALVSPPVVPEVPEPELDADGNPIAAEVTEGDGDPSATAAE